MHMSCHRDTLANSVCYSVLLISIHTHTDGQNNETIEYTKTINQLMTNAIREYNLLII